MNILLAGAGGMGSAHFRNYQQIKEAHVQALVGVSEADRRAAAEWGLPLYETITEAVQKEPVAIADLCVPTYLHEALALEAFRCGLHVITEKPCALSVQSAENMFRAAKDAGRQLYVAQVVQFTRETEVLRRIVREEPYGKPLDGFFERLSLKPAWSQGGWLLDREKSGLVPFDLHIHDLDLIVSLFGKPDHVQVSPCAANQGIRDHLRVGYAWDNGLTVCGEAAWFNAAIPFAARWRVYFERGMLIYDGNTVTGYGADGAKTVYDTADPVQIASGINLPANGWFYRELSHFLACAEKNEPSPLVPESQVLAVLSVAEKLPA